jgi:hypothetical protein
MTEKEIIKAIQKEQKRQKEMWVDTEGGLSDSKRPDYALMMGMLVEYGKLAMAIENSNGKDRNKELIHIAAVAFSWLESRNNSEVLWEWN